MHRVFDETLANDYSIKSWLKNLPNLGNHESPASWNRRNCSVAKDLSITRKRKARPSRRNKQDNDMPPKKRARANPSVPPISPPPTATFYDEHEGPVDDETPTQARFASTPSLVLSATLSRKSTVDSDTTSSTRSRSSATRSISPTKSMAALQFNIDPIRIFNFDWNNSTMPADVRSLAEKVLYHSRGKGIIPESLREQVLQALDLSPVAQDIDRMIIDNRETLGSSPHPSDFDRIIRRARAHTREGDSEASWNAAVHWPILELATYHSKHENHLQCKTITTARIHPPELVPQGTIGERSATKMVDFAIVLNSSSENDTTIENASTSVRATVDSFNQTFYPPIRLKPIAISIESKLPGKNWDDAQIQVSTWAAAQFNKYEQLMSDSGKQISQLPILPLLVVQGNEWYFLIAMKVKNSVILWSKILVGDASTIDGFYQVITVLHVLMDWAYDKLRPWLTENICY